MLTDRQCPPSITTPTSIHKASVLSKLVRCSVGRWRLATDVALSLVPSSRSRPGVAAADSRFRGGDRYIMAGEATTLL